MADRTAYVDESEPDQRIERGVYLLAAAVVLDGDAEAIRSSMERMLLPGQHKVHWNREPRRHRELVGAVAGTGIPHVVVVVSDAAAGSERRRRLCLERLLHELQDLGVSSAVLEARQAKQNAQDLAMLGALRSRQIVRPGFRITHLPGPKEPLLWLPDVVAGAYGAFRRDGSGAFDLLADHVTVHTC